MSINTTAICNNSTEFENEKLLNVSESSKEEIKTSHIEFAYALLTCVICVLGMIGNIMSIIVLRKLNMKSSANTMLIALAIFDTCYVIGEALLNFNDIVRYFNVLPEYEFFIQCAFSWLLPIYCTAQIGSVYLTTGVTIERYLVICWPLKARYICTRKHMLKGLLSIIIFSCIATLPEFFKVYHILPTLNFPISNISAAVILPFILPL